MIINVFIAFCIFLFFIISFYTVLIILLKKEIFNFRLFFKELNCFSLVPLFLLTIGGILLFILYGIVKSDFFISSIKQITLNNGLGSFGDFFNGLVTPVVSIISIIYIYKAFIQQYRANDMLSNFEFEKSIKEDLNWLRENNMFLFDIEKDINSKSFEEISKYLNEETIKINKLLYTVDLFNNTLSVLTIKKNNELKHKTEMVIKSFYLKSYKSIFRDLKDFMLNEFNNNKNYFDINSIELNFMKDFINLYENIKNLDEDKAFIFTIKSIKKEMKK